REDVTFVTFSTDVRDVHKWQIDSSDPSSPVLTDIRSYIDSLYADGNTAIYSALDRAYDEALAGAKGDPEPITSIVLMTDGENNSGIDPDVFLKRMQARPDSEKDIRVFAIRFGEAQAGALQQIAKATGGQVFDGTESLSQVFKEIRGYQ